MTYAAADSLYLDPVFRGRVRACAVEQADVFKDDQRPDWVALSASLLRGSPITTEAFVRLAASTPGLADSAGDPPDQAAVADADILSAVQASFPLVAGLYFAADGSPLPVA